MRTITIIDRGFNGCEWGGYSWKGTRNDNMWRVEGDPAEFMGMTLTRYCIETDDPVQVGETGTWTPRKVCCTTEM